MELPKQMQVPYELAFRISNILESNINRLNMSEQSICKEYIEYVKGKKERLVGRIEYGLDIESKGN